MSASSDIQCFYLLIELVSFFLEIFEIRNFVIADLDIMNLPILYIFQLYQLFQAFLLNSREVFLTGLNLKQFVVK